MTTRVRKGVVHERVQLTQVENIVLFGRPHLVEALRTRGSTHQLYASGSPSCANKAVSQSISRLSTADVERDFHHMMFETYMSPSMTPASCIAFIASFTAAMKFFAVSRSSRKP